MKNKERRMMNVINILSALLGRLSIVHCPLLIVLLLLTGCRDEADTLPTDGNRTITLDLGIALTRATEKDQPVYGEASDLHVWLFDQEDNFLGYIPEEDPQFTGRDLQGNPVESIEAEFDITNVTSIQIRVLLNINELQKPDGTPLTLGEDSNINDIDDATFQFGTTLPDGDNKVPMYGATTLDNISASRHYPVTVELTRAVGKLELFFTKESEDAYLAIDKVELAHVPDKGYLKAPEAYNLTYEGTTTLFNPDEGQVISTSLPESVTTGYFSEHESDFQRLDLIQDYLLENPNPEPKDDKWDDPETGNTDYIYPYDPENPANVAAQDTRYMMTIHYRTSESETTSKTQIVYLPRIERNVWNKIFARVKSEDGSLTIQYKVLKWEVASSAVGYAPQPAPTNDCPFSSEDNMQDFIDKNYYILLPVKAYDSDKKSWSTKDLFNDLYMNPEEGDQEARLCILTRPTYDDVVDNNNHWALKTGSAGARYYFMFTGPKGATWEARLSNTDDFAFSISETSDFEGNTDGYADNVRKVTHGIARSKPYIIEVIATHLYTGYKEGLTGETEKDTEPRFDNGFANLELSDNANAWEYLFGDTYLTTWGKGKEDAQKVVETDFYIVVTLANGAKYELTINPSYEDYESIPESDFAFENKRRYAGTDSRIKIRHVRAEHNIEKLEELAKHEEGNWKKNNIYWNPDYKW